MSVLNFSIIAGSEACNARCPFCISKMTPAAGVEMKEPEVNWRNFRKACLHAKSENVNTVMITSKGEPTLFPNQITTFLKELDEFQFPVIELQTNGINLETKRERYDSILDNWYEKGLTTIAVSIVHYEPEKNREIYVPHMKSYMDLPSLIAHLHEKKFSVRLTGVLLDGYIDSASKLEKLIEFGLENQVEQISVRPVDKPKESRNEVVYSWTLEKHLKDHQKSEMLDYLQTQGTLIKELIHGGRIYDVKGQNICFTGCLTLEPKNADIRNLIYFPDGHLRTSWEHMGAIIF